MMKLYIMPLAVALYSTSALAQGPGGRNQLPQSDPITRIMSFDANKDGKVSKAEFTDEGNVSIIL